MQSEGLRAVRLNCYAILLYAFNAQRVLAEVQKIIMQKHAAHSCYTIIQHGLSLTDGLHTLLCIIVK
jgi:hypothetical protein